MSTRYRNLDWERDDDRYGRDDDERGRHFERGLYGARGSGPRRDQDDYGYLGGAYGGGAYGRDYERGSGARDYGRGAEGHDRAEDYGRHYGPRRERDGRDFIERGYERSYGRRAHERDERDERGGHDTDYGRTTSRFFGRRGEDYGRGEDREDYGRGPGSDYGRRARRDDDDDRDERGRGDDRGWWDRASDEVRSWFGDDDAGRRRHAEDAPGGRHRGRGPRNYRRSDERIRDDINDRLTDHDWLDASDIDVTVVAGEATLTGRVESRSAKRLAEDLAESVSGVTNVQNNLRVNRGWETGLGTPAVDTAAVGDTRAGGVTGAADLTDTSDANTSVRGESSRAAGRGQS